MKKNIPILTTLFFLLFLTVSASAKTVNIADFGAIVDDDICDTQAIRNAVETVRKTGGGTIVFPAGVTKLCGQIDFVDYGNYVSYRLTGDKGAEISVSIGSGGIGFHGGNVNQVVFDNLIFTGADVPVGHPQYVDCGILFLFNYTNFVSIKDVQFYGLLCAGSIINTTNVDVVIDTAEFGGSFGGSGAIYAQNFRGLSVKNSIFIDYANYKNKFRSKSADASPAWISAVNDTMPVVNALSSQVVRIENSRFDEGSKTAVILKNLPFALVSGINVNVSGIDDGTGILADNVENLDVEFSQFGYTPAARPAINAVNNSRVFIKGIKFGGGVVLGMSDATSTIVNERSDSSAKPDEIKYKYKPVTR